MSIGLADDRLKYWNEYVQLLKDLIGLRDWSIEVGEEPADRYDGDNFATFSGIEGTKAGRIKLCCSFDELQPSTQRYIVTHELVHAHFNLMEHAVGKIMGKYMVVREVEAAREVFYLGLEYGVDAVARSWAEHLPLPPGGGASMPEGSSGE